MVGSIVFYKYIFLFSTYFHCLFFFFTVYFNFGRAIMEMTITLQGLVLLILRAYPICNSKPKPSLVNLP